MKSQLSWDHTAGKDFEAALYNIWLHSRYGNQKWFVSFSVVLRSQLQPPLQEVLSARGGEGGNEASPLYVHRRVGLSAYHVCGDYSYPVYQERLLTINTWAELQSTLQLGFIKQDM